MKKGCFFSLITLFTIITMISIYLYRSHKDDLVSFGKEKMLEIIVDKINVDISELKQTEYKDSLKSFIVKEAATIRLNKFEKFDEFGKIIERIKKYSKDKIIDSSEYANLKLMVKENEGSAQIGN